MKRVKKSDSRDGWYQLEPGDCQRLLDGQPKNRVLRESKAIGFARDMDAGKWRPNGEPVIFDENDELLDGQGRCRACVIAGKPFEAYLIYGVPRRFFPTVDTGQSRLGADTLNLAGFQNYAVAAAVVRLAIHFSRGHSLSDGRRVPNWELADWAKKNSERIGRALEDVAPFWKKSPLPPSHLVYVYMEAREIDPAKALAWATGVAFGENLSAGSPVLVLRNQLARLKGQAHVVSPYEKLAWAIKSWNQFVAGREDVKLIKWVTKGGKGKKNTEDFPVISGPAQE